MNIDIPSNYNPICLGLKIKTRGKQDIAIVARDVYKVNTYYVNRQTTVDGSREIDLKFPVTPKYMVLSIYNINKGNRALGMDNSFEVQIERKPLPLYEISITPATKEFMGFAQYFAENASWLAAGSKMPQVYRSNSGKFQIDYYNQIFDRQTGQLMTTPARIGHQYGVMEVSKKYFANYTVPMRMIILLHEYSHKYINPNTGFAIDNEVAADLNALYIYLGMGYSEMEAIAAFLNVFNDAQTDINKKRYQYIFDFIDQWNRGNIATKMAA